MKSNQYSLLSFLCGCIFLFHIGDLHASHVSSADISYKCLSGLTYRIHYTLYRDCMGTAANPGLTLHIASSSCGFTQGVWMPPLPGTGAEITNVCPGTITTCNGGNTIAGVQKWEYEVDFTLPVRCADWIFSIDDCCFNSAITTATGPVNLYLEARLNNLLNDNSSPRFTNDPVVFVCQNNDFHYNNGMLDEDGDSLVYSLTTPLYAANQNISYLPGYNATQPLTSSPGITFNDFSGDLFIHPVATEVGILSYLIIDYRNGELMGSVMRNTSIYTIPCNDQNPELSGINGTTVNTIYVLPGSYVCFDIYSFDPDTGQTLVMNWNNAIPSATFISTGSPFPTGTFCWATSLSDLRPQPYMFTSTIMDNSCPYLGVSVYSYFIYVTLDSSLVTIGDSELNFFSVAPNPSNGIFTIQSTRQFCHIKIYNSLGTCVLNKEFENRVTLSEQPAGIYFVEAITNEGKAKRMKLVKE